MERTGGVPGGWSLDDGVGFVPTSGPEDLFS